MRGRRARHEELHAELHAEAFRIPLRKPRGLLVEDEVTQLDARRELLRLHNLDVIPATSKAEAIGRLRSVNYRVDVVITDLNLEPDSASLQGGIDVAGAVGDNSGQSIPVYAYSGKTATLPADSHRLFRAVVLKSETGSAVRGLFDQASAEAYRHLQRSVDRAKQIALSLDAGPKELTPQEVALLRDLVAGATRSDDGVNGTTPEAIGILSLGTDGGLPYAIEAREGPAGTRYYATALGHEYLYGYGRDRDAAASSLKDAIGGFMQLIDGPIGDAVGPSKRLRRLLLALASADEGEA